MCVLSLLTSFWIKKKYKKYLEILDSKKYFIYSLSALSSDEDSVEESLSLSLSDEESLLLSDELELVLLLLLDNPFFTILFCFPVKGLDKQNENEMGIFSKNSRIYYLVWPNIVLLFIKIYIHVYTIFQKYTIKMNFKNINIY